MVVLFKLYTNAILLSVLLQEQHCGDKGSKISLPQVGVSEGPTGDAGESSETDPAIEAMARRAFVITELIETERDYVRDLRLVVEGYMILARDPANADPPLPEDLADGKIKMVFGNLEAIYEWHRESVFPFHLIIIVLFNLCTSTIVFSTVITISFFFVFPVFS